MIMCGKRHVAVRCLMSIQLVIEYSMVITALLTEVLEFLLGGNLISHRIFSVRQELSGLTFSIFIKKKEAFRYRG